nr:peptidase M15D vanX D-ala-D-ala dipeptidase [Nocardioides sp.]
EDSEGRCYTRHPDVRGAAREMRDVLTAALSAVGLVNYPTEWWHWSHGDRYWAMVTGADRAPYATVERV